MDVAALSSTKSLRRSVLKWMCLCFGLLSAFFALFNLFINNFKSLGLLELFFSAYCFYTFNCVYKNKEQPNQAFIMCSWLSVIVIIGTYASNLNNGLFIWTIVLPVTFYLILGKRYGVVLTAILLSAQLIVIVNKSSLAPFSESNITLNLLFAFISIWLVSHIFETSRAHFSARLRNLAMLDPLTGAGNRLSMNHYFEVEIIDKTKLYMVLVDLDFFKKINDQYGHGVGDQVLVEVVTLLKVTLPKGYVFRVGGEEFAILAQFDSFAAAIAATEKLRLTIEQNTIVVDNKQVNITASLGMTQYKAPADLKQFTSAADEQLYKAKVCGRNRVYYQSAAQHDNAEKQCLC